MRNDRGRSDVRQPWSDPYARAFGFTALPEGPDDGDIPAKFDPNIPQTPEELRKRKAVRELVPVTPPVGSDERLKTILKEEE